MELKAAISDRESLKKNEQALREELTEARRSEVKVNEVAKGLKEEL